MSRLEERKYKKAQQEAIAAFQIGAKDEAGYTISHIFAKSDEFIVYDAAELPSHESIRIYIKTKKDDDTTLIDNYNKVKKYLDGFKSHCYKYKCGVEYKRRAATALAHGIYGDTDEAIRKFNDINSEIIKDHEESVRARLCYQIGAFTPVIVLSVILLFIYLFRDAVFFVKNPLFLTLPVCLFWASLGGYLSVSLTIKNTDREKSLKRRIYYFYGVERCLIALVAGVICYAIIKSGLVLDLLNKEDNKYVLFIIYLLSGFSETLIPNALKSIERKID